MLLGSAVVCWELMATATLSGQETPARVCPAAQPGAALWGLESHAQTWHWPLVWLGEES